MSLERFVFTLAQAGAGGGAGGGGGIFKKKLLRSWTWTSGRCGRCGKKKISHHITILGDISMIHDLYHNTDSRPTAGPLRRRRVRLQLNLDEKLRAMTRAKQSGKISCQKISNTAHIRACNSNFKKKLQRKTSRYKKNGSDVIYLNFIFDSNVQTSFFFYYIHCARCVFAYFLERDIKSV